METADLPPKCQVLPNVVSGHEITAIHIVNHPERIKSLLPIEGTHREGPAETLDDPIVSGTMESPMHGSTVTEGRGTSPWPSLSYRLTHTLRPSGFH